MTHITCLRCQTRWESGRLARCPRCLSDFWQSREAFITAKHHPDSNVEAEPGYRSVLTPHFLAHLAEFVDFAAATGHWYFDTHYLRYVHFTPEPLGRAPGVGIPAGRRVAEHALDSMLIADATEHAHVFAVQRAVVEAQIKAGEFAPLERCGEPDCARLRDPEDARCAVHSGRAEPASTPPKG